MLALFIESNHAMHRMPKPMLRSGFTTGDGERYIYCGLTSASGRKRTLELTSLLQRVIDRRHHSHPLDIGGIAVEIFDREVALGGTADLADTAA